MAIDFTGVTNVFMGGNGNVYSADTSLQGVYQGETEQWAYSDQGYVWRAMGGTKEGYERFTVGDVVCFGYGGSDWNGMPIHLENIYDCYIPNNYLSTYDNGYAIYGIKYENVLSWSDEFGTDGVKIGWHLPDKTDTLNMVNHSYVVKQTANNGMDAKFSQGYGTLGTITSGKYMYMYPLNSATEHWWRTSCNYYVAQDSWCFGKIYDNQTSTYIYIDATPWRYTTNADNLTNRHHVIFKRVKINANNQ